MRHGAGDLPEQFGGLHDLLSGRDIEPCLKDRAEPAPRLLPHPYLQAVVGFLSAVVGSAGALGALLFLGLGLPATAYVATEAVTATAMHVTKTVVYGRYGAMTAETWALGLALSAAMILGSWTGKKFIERLSKERFSLLVEVLLVAAALSLILTGR